jgi:hypothetical protein
MKKIVFLFLGGLVVFFIFQFFYFIGANYISNNKCKESKYVACDDGVIIEFTGYKINEVENLKIFVIQKGNLKKKITAFFYIHINRTKEVCVKSTRNSLYQGL